MRKLEKSDYLRQNPAKFSWRGTAEKTADEVADNVSHTLSTIPNFWDETTSNNSLTTYQSNRTNFSRRAPQGGGDFYSSSTENEAFPMMYGEIKGPPNVFQKTSKWVVDKTIDGTEKVLNFGKENFINPYPNAQINTIETLMGKWVETDYETAKKTGGLIFPKFVRNFTIGSYLGKWSQTLLMPTGIPKAIWKLKQKVFVPPIMWVGDKVINGYRKIKKTLGIYSNNKEKTWRESALQRLSSLRSWVNQKISLRERKPIIAPIDWEARQDAKSHQPQETRLFRGNNIISIDSSRFGKKRPNRTLIWKGEEDKAA